VRERIRVRELSNEETNTMMRTVTCSSNSVVIRRRAQMALLLAQGMDVVTTPRSQRWPSPAQTGCGR
jgi:hypothetical protein